MAYQFKIHPPQLAPPGFSLPVWTDPAFMQAIAKFHKLTPHHLVCYKGDALAAVLPLYERSRLGIKHLVCPAMAYYQPLSLFVEPGTLAPRQNWDSLQIMSGMAQLIGKTYRKVHFNLDPQSTDVRAFSWAGFGASPLYTYTHSSPELPRPTRNEQRKLKTASQQGYCYNEDFIPEDFIRLLSQLYAKKQHRVGFSLSKLEISLNELNAAGLLHQCNLLREDRIVSSNIVFGTGSGTAYAVIGATLEAEMQYGASSMQAMEMLRHLLPRYDQVDFCGANVADVARFKSGLGLDLKLFFRIEGSACQA